MIWRGGRPPLRRIQELSRAIGTDQVKVQLWDVSGKQDYQTHWPALAQVCGRPRPVTCRDLD
jgi:hypothetical protein